MGRIHFDLQCPSIGGLDLLNVKPIEVLRFSSKSTAALISWAEVSKLVYTIKKGMVR